MPVWPFRCWKARQIYYTENDTLKPLPLIFREIRPFTIYFAKDSSLYLIDVSIYEDIHDTYEYNFPFSVRNLFKGGVTFGKIDFYFLSNWMDLSLSRTQFSFRFWTNWIITKLVGYSTFLGNIEKLLELYVTWQITS